MLIRKIPQEILQQIFSFLDRDDLRIAMLVCNHWYQTTVQVYFQKVVVSEEHLRFDQPFKHAQLTMELVLSEPHRNHQDGLSSQDFLTLLSRLPYLKKLNMISSRHYANYLREIAKYEGKTSLRYIEEIVPIPIYNQIQLVYFTACYNLRYSIRRLEVYACNYQIKNEVHSILYFLPQFNRLTHLKVKNVSRKSDITLFDILLCCQHLTDLDYNVHSPVPLRAKQQLGITNNMHLIRLTLGLSSDATAYLDYIRSNYCLQSLTLIINENIYWWFYNFDSFAGSLRKFKHLTIKSKQGANLQNILNSQTQAFYNFLTILKGDRDSRFEATFRKSESGDGMDDIIQVRDYQRMSFTYHINDDTPFSFFDDQGIVKSVRFYTGKEDFPSDVIYYAKRFRNLERIHILLKYASLYLSETSMYINAFFLSSNIFDRLYYYSPNIECMDCSGSYYGEGQRKFYFNLERFKNLKVFSFALKQLNTNAHEYTFVKLDCGRRSVYRRIFCRQGAYYIQPVSEQYVLQFPWDSFTCIFRFYNSSVKIHFRE